MSYPKGKVVTFGEIMMRLSTPGFARFSQVQSLNVTYGGGEANVAISLAQFGVESEHITRFPDNDLGYAATALLNKYGVKTNHIEYGGSRLGLYFLETGASVRPSKVVYDRFGSSFSEIKGGTIPWEEVLTGASFLHFTGIAPAISQGAADVCLEAIATANKMGVTVSVDVNYRKNLWQYGKKPSEIMQQIITGCDLIFASKGDMEELFPVKATGDSDKFLDVCRQMMSLYPRLKRIINTKRGSVSASHNTLSAVMYNGAVLLKTGTLEINPIVDRIGGGDAFCAGLLYGLMHYDTDEQALEFGLAASVLKHSVEGDANLVSVKEVELVMGGDTSGKLSR